MPPHSQHACDLAWHGSSLQLLTRQFQKESLLQAPAHCQPVQALPMRHPCSPCRQAAGAARQRLAAAACTCCSCCCKLLICQSVHSEGAARLGSPECEELLQLGCRRARPQLSYPADTWNMTGASPEKQHTIPVAAQHLSKQHQCCHITGQPTWLRPASTPAVPWGQC